MRAAVLSTVCASVSFFAPGADLRPAVQPAVVLQPAVQAAVGTAPRAVLIPSARAAGKDDASARWFAYGLCGALFTMAIRSAARPAAPVAVPRPAARFHALRMSAVEQSSTEAEPAVFTEEQIREKMRQLPGVWKKSENGYWEDVETEEVKRARAVEMLQEALANVKPRRVRAKGLAATKGFTGDEFAFVYRSGGASLLGKEKKKKTSDKKEADETAAAEMDPSGFTEKQIRDKMRQLPGEWQKSENGYWEDVETDEAKRARAIEMLQEALANVKPRRVRATGLTATKGFTGDEFAFVYRSGQRVRKPASLARGTAKVDESDSDKRDGEGDSSVAPESSDAGMVVPIPESPEPKPEETPDEPTQSEQILGDGI